MFNKKVFYINSRNRTAGTDANFTYSIDMKGFSRPPTHCVVLQANIPKSFYIVQGGQNTFTLTEEGGANSATVTIPVGNYSRLSFRTTLQTLLNTTSPNGYTYAVTTPTTSSAADTGKFTFTCTGHTLESGFVFTSDSNVFELMGFDIGSTNAFVGGSLVSSNVIKLSKEDTMLIHSDLVSGMSSDILQEIYTVESNDFSNIVFQNFAPELYEKQITNSSTSNTFQFFITNEDGQYIDLNGLNWSLTLCCYTKDNTNSIFRDYMRYNLTQ
jgi:hypothetical protein